MKKSYKIGSLHPKLIGFAIKNPPPPRDESTGSTTQFNLGSEATFTGEVVAIADGITQATND